MRWLGFIKRFVPFLLTFCVGLFIASFFISVAAPNLEFESRGRKRHRDCDRRMQLENQRLREMNESLMRERMNANPAFDMNLDVPPPPMPPMPPPPPRIARIDR